MATTPDSTVERTLQRFVVRKEHTLCTRCGEMEPINVGDGVPAPSLIAALYSMGRRHMGCKVGFGTKKAKV